MDISWWSLVRAVHVACAAVWFGSVVFGTFFIAPTVRSAGDAGRGFMQTVATRGGFGRFLSPFAVITLLSGGFLYWRAGYFATPFATSSHALLTLGAVLAVGGWLYGTFGNLALQRRLRNAPPDAARAMQASLMRRGRGVGILVLAAFVLMVGRNVFG